MDSQELFRILSTVFANTIDALVPGILSLFQVVAFQSTFPIPVLDDVQDDAQYPPT